MAASNVSAKAAQWVGRGEAVDSPWRSVYRVGAWAALTVVICTFIQAAVYILWPPPSFDPSAGAVTDWFALLHKNWLIGLLDLDLLMLIDYPGCLLVFLALYGALRRVSNSWAAIAAALGFTGIAAYFAVNPAFTMLALSHQYGLAATELERTMLVAAGQATLGLFVGSGFNASYILVSVAGLIMSVLMLRSSAFGRRAAWVGIVFYALGLVPATAGTLGLVFSLASLPPMVVWLILVARSLFRLAREEGR